MRPKVLFVLPNFAGGGAERVLLTLLEQLDRQDFAPQLAVLDGRGPLRSLLAADAELFEFGQPRLRSALPALLAVIRRERPAVIFASHGYLNMALLLARPLMPAGTRLALRESNTPSQSLPNHRFSRLMATAYRWLYPRADVVFCQHEQTEQEMRDGFHVAAEKVVPLPNPVAVERLRRAAALPTRPAGAGLHFVAAGRLHRQKGFDRLISLSGDLTDDARVTIYGEGPERERLQQHIDATGLAHRVALEGFNEKLSAALAGADACVISSRWEGLPNVALEALAVGTPVIATTESGGIPELAEAAAPGAVTVVPWGADFAAAMSACVPRHATEPAPSLLPECYNLPRVAAIFNNRLRHLTGLEISRCVVQADVST